MGNDLQTMPQSQGVAKIAGNGAFAFTPQNYTEARNYADDVAKSGLCPNAYKGKPDDILVAWQMGNELGIKPMQALQGIAVINGKPSVYGDLFLAVIQAHPDFEWIEESDDGNTATCKVKRRGMPVTVRTFSNEDAKTAGLLGKAGPWTNYPKRMRAMRARGFAGRDSFADALKGIVLAEEATDYETVATVDAKTEVVVPRRASEVKPEPSPAVEAVKTETPTDAKLEATFKITKATRTGTRAYAYDGETKYYTEHQGFQAVLKAAKDGDKAVRVAYIQEGENEKGEALRQLTDVQLVEA